MTRIPRVTIAPAPDGLLVTCHACRWSETYRTRPGADQRAAEHQKTCKQGRRR